MNSLSRKQHIHIHTNFVNQFLVYLWTTRVLLGIRLRSDVLHLHSWSGIHISFTATIHSCPIFQNLLSSAPSHSPYLLLSYHSCC